MSVMEMLRQLHSIPPISAMVGMDNRLSHRSGNPQRVHSNEQRGISWPVKAILLGLALLGGFFDHALGGWGEPVAMAAAAVVVPVLLGQSRKFWNQRQF